MDADQLLGSPWPTLTRGNQSRPDGYLSCREAAARLGVSVGTLYDWLARSDTGLFVLRGHSVTIDYLQGGSKGQGRIRIQAQEIERLQELMRVRPRRVLPRRPPATRRTFPGITAPLGRPPSDNCRLGGRR